MIKIKLTQDNGMKKTEEGKTFYVKDFFNFQESDGTEIELTEKQIAYVKRANTQFEKSQKLLKDAYKAKG